MRKDSNNQLDVHQFITNSIVAAIEAGASNASLPWHRTDASSILPKNVATGSAYNGISVLALCATAQDSAYTPSLWGTYRQF
jgi:antirestriction protein ArdC